MSCSDGPLAPELDALVEARARWEASNPVIYEFEFQRFCFCGGDTIRPVRIEVIAGVVNAATFVDTEEPVADLGSLPTIEDLFDEIQDAIDREAHSIEAEYDATLGYPTSVSIDFILEAVDEEMAFSVNSLTFPLQQSKVSGA